MNKADRQKVFDKFDGRCAYTGKPLGDDWQVDHKISKREHSMMLINGVDNFDNLMPCMKIINHYKRGLFFDRWRHRISVLHIRLSKLPKTTRSSRSIKLKKYLTEIAEAFDIDINKPFSGKFYFETIQTPNQ